MHSLPPSLSLIISLNEVRPSDHIAAVRAAVAEGGVVLALRDHRRDAFRHSQQKTAEGEIGGDGASDLSLRHNFHP